jgi:cytochrome c oxidase cbb3-type subunit I/II
VHSGTLGWNGFITFAMVYWLVPRLWKTELYSNRLANTHFWIGLLGTVTYVVSMWVAGITQGLMWRALDGSGKLLYPDFLETVTRIVPLYYVRAAGGALYLAGYVLGLYNVYRTIRQAPRVREVEVVRAPALRPVAALAELGSRPHRMLEGLPQLFTSLTFIAVAIGGIVEFVPTMLSSEYVEANPAIRPYTPLQLHGRDIYVREGCYLCHSQMIRPIESETMRYGDYSRPEESEYDHPFQWGSKRTGPDLARVGGKYPDLWHFRHMQDPRDVSPGSIMPPYPWLFSDQTDFGVIGRKVEVMKQLGVPYTDADVKGAEAAARAEASRIAEGLKSQGVSGKVEDKEIVALIAYLQRLGADWKKAGGK